MSYEQCTLDQVIAALQFVSADCARREWALIGMAIKSEFPDAFDVFDNWSSGGDSYKPADALAAWKSFKSGGATTIATLFSEAQKGGYTFERRELTAQEKADFAREREVRRVLRVELEAQQAVEDAAWHAGIARAANEIWDLLSEQGASLYLKNKGVRAWGAVRFVERGLIVEFGCEAGDYRVLTGAGAISDFFNRRTDDVSFLYFKSGALVLGVFDEGGALVNVQAILPSGKKLFLKHGRKSGCCSVVGDLVAAGPLCFAEGYATAASIYEATGWPVVIVFDNGNMANVVARFRAAYPSRDFIIAADDDRDTKGNPGLTSAREAAAQFSAVVALPVFNFAEAVNG